MDRETRIKIATAFVLVTCFVRFSFSQQKGPISEEEYSVLFAVIGRSDFVIVNETGDNPYPGFGGFDISKDFKEVSPETIADFNQKNKNKYALEQKFPTNGSYVIIGHSEFEKYFPHDFTTGWEAFREKYPKAGGFYSASRVGFSKDGKLAFAFVSFSCGSLCADGTYYLLEKDNNVWKVIKKVTAWVS